LIGKSVKYEYVSICFNDSRVQSLISLLFTQGPKLPFPSTFSTAFSMFPAFHVFSLFKLLRATFSWSGSMPVPSGTEFSTQRLTQIHGPGPSHGVETWQRETTGGSGFRPSGESLGRSFLAPHVSSRRGGCRRSLLSTFSLLPIFLDPI